MYDLESIVQRSIITCMIFFYVVIIQLKYLSV